jgi:cytochrome c biogenesis protein CcdA
MFGAAVVVALWRPCVGTELGNVVSAAGHDRLGAMIPTVVYMTGLGSLIVAVGLVPVALPAVARLAERRAVIRAGIVSGLGLGALVALGWWAELADELLRLSTV